MYEKTGNEGCMEDLINGRTPEEIKAAIRHCESTNYCNVCPYADVIECGDAIQHDSLALIERLESERDAALAKVPRWISVEERLPEQNGIYLAHVVHRYCKIDSYWRVCIEYFGIEGTWDSLADIYEVTHWMPLPEPPKEDEE
ncbi:MAG: DUF551 domain-containing protein [Clostridiales bacterium]|nr:DUF551 domain-containing protein [Clostridiales bacterium]